MACNNARNYYSPCSEASGCRLGSAAATAAAASCHPVMPCPPPIPPCPPPCLIPGPTGPTGATGAQGPQAKSIYPNKPKTVEKGHIALTAVLASL
ncbi:MAG: hypothetical protein LBM87_01685 [Ruminococcus sp.]|nr:hypothetical protein [Ruminococcus sp.]